MIVADEPLLAPDEPPAFRVVGAQGGSPFLLTCDHASARIPRRLGSLGVSTQDLQRHIAWDIGVAAVSELLAARLDAFLILQNYSRLVIDCNRPPGSEQSIVRLSEATAIPGNEAVSRADAQAREREIFRPYHNRIAAELDRRAAIRRPTILVAMHSFTPCYLGNARPWHIGVLYNRDARLAHPLLRVLRTKPDLVVGDNEPYAVGDISDYTIPVYGEQRGLLHAGVEIRQDLIGATSGQEEWADRLADVLRSAIAGGET